ncbi:hypothetical protein GCM10009641_08760 [Mycobacterium cookii]|uniref:Uncharacterized protein n=1 Tax=Mycobacterium cookii TaxID=1775 RepID=A0A7I7L132_9MYCO|nr:hypothetical protein MCOO_40950 [Mycobacterium cookii]
MQISKFRLAVAGVVTAASFSLAGAGVAAAYQPHMVNAREHLNQALFELQTADPDKGGHRDMAVDLVHRAIDQVNMGIDYADLHP